jgi:polysaccharide biosynthesis/export protein
MEGKMRSQYLGLIFCAALCAQQPPTQQQVGAPQQLGQAAPGQGQPAATQPAGQETGSGRLRPNYILGPGDQILIRAFEMEEIGDRPYLVDGDGVINLPQLGRLTVSGLSVEQVEALLITKMKTFVQKPQATVTIVQFRSEPVFFVGAFKAPGIYPLQGRRTLVEVLSTIGGLLPNASRRIKITRRKEMGPLPLPGAIESADGKVTSAEISMGSLRENVNPAEDIVLQPFDVISVERAEMVYVNGEIGRVGGFELGERESISVVQIISLAGGLSRDAMPSKARILRPVLNSSRRSEVPIDITRILSGKDNDFPLLPNDLLYIPKAKNWKQSASRIALFAVPITTTILFRVLR